MAGIGGQRLVFFSPDEALIERGKKILTRRLGRSALDVVGWRKVPTCPEVVGEQRGGERHEQDQLEL